jgi:hypothetical protein
VAVGDVPDRPLPRAVADHEIAAGTDFAAIEVAFVTARDELVAAWAVIQATQIEELAGIIEELATVGEVAALGSLAATPRGEDLLFTSMMAVVAEAMNRATAEAAAQGVVIVLPDLSTFEAAIQARAAAIDTLLANSIGQAAARQALLRVGGSLTPAEIADAVSESLGELSDAFLADVLGGAITQAENAGRVGVMDEGPAATYYASEILDGNTCDPCAALDGTEYETLEEALADYPSGGYAECLGGARCRGTLVAVYDEALSEEVA